MIWAAAAAAEEPSPARRYAEAAAGAEVEVCLRLAVEHPEAVDEIASALVAHVDRAQSADRALLDALLLLASDRPVDGARLLGVLGDPRAVPVLYATVRTRELPVATAAVAALAGYPEAVPVLAGWLTDRSLPEELRLAAADTLGEARRPEAADALQDTLRQRLPATVRQRVASALRRWYPDRAPPEDLPPSTDGAPWVATGASLGFGYAMGVAGHFGRTEGLWTVGALTGAIGGASVGWLYGRAWPVEAGDAAFVATTGTAGTIAGLLVGADAGDLDTALLVGLGGELAGYATGAALAGLHRGTEVDALEAAAVASFAAGAGAYAATWSAEAGLGARRSATSAGLALAGGLALGHVAAPYADLGRGAGLVATGGAVGLAVGLLAPLGEVPRSTLPGAGLFGGLAAGALLCAPIDPRGDVLIGSWTGGAFGTALGIGAGLVLSSDTPDLARGLALGGLAIGATTGGAVAWVDPDPIDDRDVALSVAATGWAAWNALAIGSLADEPGPREVGAIVLATAGVGSLATALNVALDVPVPHTLTATSLGLWGGYAGAATATLLDLPPVALALPLSDAGLAIGALALSPVFSTPPLVIGVADAGGVIGASLGALGAGILVSDGDTVLAASLGGAAVGLASGAVVGTIWHRSGTRRDMALHLPGRLPGRLSVGPLALADGAGATVGWHGW